MIINQAIRQMFKLNNRFFSHGGKSKASNNQAFKEASKKDPDVEVFGKKERSGNEVVDEQGNLEMFSPMPEHIKRGKLARIYQRSKHVMQQGTDNTKHWILEFGTEQRWENPTMGWCSSMCAAVCYAEKQGLKYVFDESKPKKEFKSNYSDNFSWNKRTRISTK